MKFKNWFEKWGGWLGLPIFALFLNTVGLGSQYFLGENFPSWLGLLLAMAALFGGFLTPFFYIKKKQPYSYQPILQMVLFVFYIVFFYILGFKLVFG